MAATTRGKLKEHMGGIHTNCDWIKKHATDCINLLPDGYEQLRVSFDGLIEIADQLDNFAQRIYGNL